MKVADGVRLRGELKCPPHTKTGRKQEEERGTGKKAREGRGEMQEKRERGSDESRGRKNIRRKKRRGMRWWEEECLRTGRAVCVCVLIFHRPQRDVII